MTFQELQTCWYYYLSFKDDLAETSRYIEPAGQEKTYSFEFYKIIMLGCAEVETAFKQICNLIDSNNKCGTIAEYKRMILGKYPKICTCKVVAPRWSNKEIFPFDGWDTTRLAWWDSYQNLKHHRYSAIECASYENAVYTLAALFILIQYLYNVY